MRLARRLDDEGQTRGEIERLRAKNARRVERYEMMHLRVVALRRAILSERFSRMRCRVRSRVLLRVCAREQILMKEKLQLQLSSNDIEKIEEAKLKAKFPNAAGRPLGGHSAFLQKRLAKGVSVSTRFILCELYDVAKGTSRSREIGDIRRNNESRILSAKVLRLRRLSDGETKVHGEAEASWCFANG